MWILVKVLSFGLISELFMILKPEDQKEIAKYYKMDAYDMTVFLPIMSNYRNLCAHEDMLYTYRTQRSIPNNIYHSICSCLNQISLPAIIIIHYTYRFNMMTVIAFC